MPENTKRMIELTKQQQLEVLAAKGATESDQARPAGPPPGGAPDEAARDPAPPEDRRRLRAFVARGLNRRD